MILFKDRQFMNDARHIAGNSKCRRAQFGTLIIRPENGRPVASACNGKPSKSTNDGVCYREGLAPNDPKRNCCLHSEANAILFSSPMEREGAWMYVTGMPCEDCGLLIMQSGAARLVYLGIEDGSHPGWIGEPVEAIFEAYGFARVRFGGRHIEVVRYTDAEWKRLYSSSVPPIPEDDEPVVELGEMASAMSREIARDWNEKILGVFGGNRPVDIGGPIVPINTPGPGLNPEVAEGMGMAPPRGKQWFVRKPPGEHLIVSQTMMEQIQRFQAREREKRFASEPE